MANPEAGPAWCLVWGTHEQIEQDSFQSASVALMVVLWEKAYVLICGWRISQTGGSWRSRRAPSLYLLFVCALATSSLNFPLWKMGIEIPLQAHCIT